MVVLLRRLNALLKVGRLAFNLAVVHFWARFPKRTLVWPKPKANDPGPLLRDGSKQTSTRVSCLCKACRQADSEAAMGGPDNMSSSSIARFSGRMLKVPFVWVDRIGLP